MNQNRQLGFSQHDGNFSFVDEDKSLFADQEPKAQHENKELPLNDLNKLRQVYYMVACVSIFVDTNCGCRNWECSHRIKYEVIELEIPSYFDPNFMQETGLYEDENFRAEVAKKYGCKTVGTMQVKQKPLEKTKLLALLNKQSLE